DTLKNEERARREREKPTTGTSYPPPTGWTDSGCGLIVDVGFGFELGEHRLEKGLVGVGGAGDGKLHFLGGEGEIAAVGREGGLAQMALAGVGIGLGPLAIDFKGRLGVAGALQ